MITTSSTLGEMGGGRLIEVSCSIGIGCSIGARQEYEYVLLAEWKRQFIQIQTTLGGL